MRSYICINTYVYTYAYTYKLGPLNGRRARRPPISIPPRLANEEPVVQPGRGVVAAALAAVALLLVLLCLREEVSPDTWFHLAAGRWIVDHGAVPTTNVFLALHRDHPFFDHEW